MRSSIVLPNDLRISCQSQRALGSCVHWLDSGRH